MIYQMMNGRISKRTLTKMIKAYYMCAQNGVVYKGYTEWTGDKLSYVRKYILCKCADRRINSKNIDEGCGTDELDIVWLNDGLLLIAEKDAVVQGRTLNRAFYRLPVNNETDKKSADVKNTVHNKISNNDLESLKPERIFAGNLVVLKIESTSDGSNVLAFFVFRLLKLRARAVKKDMEDFPIFLCSGSFNVCSSTMYSSVSYEISLYVWLTILAVLCNICFFHILRTYVGVIRFSSFVDIYRVFWSRFIHGRICGSRL